MFSSTEINTNKKKGKIVQELNNFKNIYKDGIIIFQGFTKIQKKNYEYLNDIIIEHLFTNSNNFLGIIPTRSLEDTIVYLKNLAYREQIIDNPVILSRVKNKQKYLADAQIFFIEGFMLCGKKKAKELLEKYGSPLKIIELIKENQKELLKINGIGKLFLDKNIKLLFDHLS